MHLFYANIFWFLSSCFHTFYSEQVILLCRVLVDDCLKFACIINLFLIVLFRDRLNNIWVSITRGIIHNANLSQEQLRKMSQLSVLQQESNLCFCDGGAMQWQEQKCRFDSCRRTDSWLIFLNCTWLEFALCIIPLVIETLKKPLFYIEWSAKNHKWV